MDNMFLRLSECIDKVYPIIKENVQNEGEFVMFFGTIIDFWTADHDMSVEESKNLVRTLYEIHADVNNAIGMVKKKEVETANED